MSKEVQLGKIIIRDVHENDLFDPQNDVVTTVTGRVLSEKEKTRELSNILKELNVDNWQGILLSGASVYLQQMNLARKFAPQGQVEEVREALKKAEEASRQTFLPFDKRKADELLKTALTKGIEAALQSAEKMAKNGKNVSDIEAAIEKAKTYSRDYEWIKGGRSASGLEEKAYSLDEKRLDAILKTAGAARG